MSYVQELRVAAGHRPLILVAAGVFISDESQRILLQRRADSGSWGIPGGCMELGETLEETARREVKEETNLKVGDMTLFGVFSGEELHYQCPNGDQVEAVCVVYQTEDVSGDLKTDNSETLELRFFTREELETVELTRTNKHIIRAFLNP